MRRIRRSSQGGTVAWIRRWLFALAAPVLAVGLLAPGAGMAAGAPVVPMPEALVPAAASWGQQPPGDGSAAVSSVPVAVTRTGVLAGETVATADVGRTGGCAVTLSGQVACWGTSFLGDGTANGSPVPVNVKDTGALAGRTVASVSVGDGFSCVVTTDGGAFCWGRNTYGQLGDGTTIDRLEPVAVLKPGALAGKAVTSITAGTDHACLTAVGLVPGYPVAGRGFCWGRNSDGQLGTGSVGGQFSAPQMVVLPGGDHPWWPFHNLAAGARHTCAQVEASDYPGFVAWSTYCWGDNSMGQLGQGPGGPPRSATMLKLVLPVGPGEPFGWDTRELTVGDNHSCMMPGFGEVGWFLYGSVHCWGSNSHGQLGNGQGGPGQFSGSVVTVGGPFTFGLPNPDWIPPRANGFVAAGQAHTCAVTDTRRVACWGSEYWGTVGNGVQGTSIGQYPTLFTNTPVAVDTTGVLAGVDIAQVAAGGNRSLALPDFPGAPTDVAVRAGDASAWVAFTPPSPWSGQVTAPITNYEYRLSGPNGDNTWHAFNPPTTTSPVQITGLVNGLEYLVSLRAVTEAPGRESTSGYVAPHPDTPSIFVPMAPVRLVDSRTSGTGGSPQPLAPGERRGMLTNAVVPAGATAIAYNLTVPTPAASGHLRLMPGDVIFPEASAVNFQSGHSIANASITRVDAMGAIALYNGSTGPAHYVIDVLGYFLPQAPGAGAAVSQVSGSLFNPIAPARAYDSRTNPAGPLAGLSDRVVDLSALVPAGATAVTYNLTVPDTLGDGHLRVMPANVATTPTSAINWTTSGEVIANGSVVVVDPQRRIRVYNGGGAPAHLVVDVTGYYLPSAGGVGAAFHPVDPARNYDSRKVLTPPSTSPSQVPLPAGDQRDVSVANAVTAEGQLFVADLVPPGAVAVAYDVAATGTQARGHLRVFPAGTPLPAASTLNWPGSGISRANGITGMVSGGRQMTVYNGSTGSTQVIVDTVGYFQ